MYYSLQFVSVLFAASCVAGFFGALLGVGGGIFIVPFMVLMFHLPVKVAVAASLVSVIATSNAGGSSYVDQHITNLRLAMFLEIATTLGALAGSVLAVYLHEWVLLLIFGAMLAYMSFTAFQTRHLDDRRISSGEFANAAPDRFSRWLDLRGSYRDIAAARQVDYVVNGTAIGASVASLAGLASGLLGVGGGVIKVSAMNHYMNVPMKVAVGTSKLMIGVTAAVGAILFLFAGLVRFHVVAPVALGTTVGATVGTTVMNRLHSSMLKYLFVALMAYLAYGMFAKALNTHWGMHIPILAG
jgi:uncharacterized membrane protein YfcA